MNEVIVVTTALLNKRLLELGCEDIEFQSLSCWEHVRDDAGVITTRSRARTLTTNVCDHQHEL